MTYYRIEALDTKSGSTIGGYVSAATAVFCNGLGLNPGFSAEKLHEALETTENENAKERWKSCMKAFESYLF